MNTFQLIASDYKKYRKYGGSIIGIVFLTQSFWAIFQYRLANSIYRNVNIPGIRHFLRFIFLLWQKLIEMITGISIPSSASIGDSFYIGHFGGIIINSKAVIGNNCNISQGVTIGVSGKYGKRGVPIIKNNVYIGANSVIAGNIIIEDDVLIGACSLVNSDVLKNSVMLGVPAIRISENSSQGYI